MFNEVKRWVVAKSKATSDPWHKAYMKYKMAWLISSICLSRIYGRSKIKLVKPYTDFAIMGYKDILDGN